MKIEELKRRLKAGEWNDVEFKEARSAVPKSAFETVSAFANTHGGWMVFGVAQHGEEFQISGVEKTDKVQNDFLSVLHADAKINHDIDVDEKRLDIGDKVVLIFRQDYGDHSRKAVIKFFRNGIQFWNPGDVFGDDSRLFEPGEKEVRNPSIAMGMRRITMCEQAGTGMRMMREEWQKLGHPEPTYKNDRSWKAFEFFIPELDEEVDMASDLMKAMFERTGPTETRDDAQVTGKGTPQVAPQAGTKSGPSRDQVGTKSGPSSYHGTSRFRTKAYRTDGRSGKEKPDQVQGPSPGSLAQCRIR